MIPHPRRVLLTALLLLVAVETTPAVAGDTGDGLTLGAAITAALTGSPDLSISALDTRLTATEAQKIAGVLDTRVNSRVGISEDQTPVASDFQPEQTRLAGASGGVTKPLASGAELQTAIDYNRTQQEFTSPLAAQLARINPAYRGSISVTYRHPLGRGADRPGYRDALSAADAETLASSTNRAVIARDIGLRTVTTWYQMLSADISIRLAEVAVDRARRLLEYQRLRKDFGLIETADLKQAEALLATRALELQEARAAREQHQVALNRLMRRDPGAAISVVAARNPAGNNARTLDAMFEVALRHRPEFQVLDAQLEASIARQRIARDASRSQVDLVAELGSMSLDRNPPDAAMDSFSLDNHFAGLSLEISETMGNRAATAGNQQALLARQRVLLERQRVAEQVRDELAGLLTTLRTGAETVRLARLKVTAEQNKFDAELTRYRDGRSDTATVIQFEGELHGAERQADLLQLSLTLAEHQLAWSSGTLFADLGVTLPPETGEPAQ